MVVELCLVVGLIGAACVSATFILWPTGQQPEERR